MNAACAEMLAGDVRAGFPCFAAPEWEGIHYLDNAATTQKPLSVIQAVSRSMSRGTAPVHRGLYPLADQATRGYEQARAAVAKLLAAAGSREIVFTASATAAIHLVAEGWVAPRLAAGDEICVTRMEHHSNLLPWQRLCKLKGATLRFIEFDDEGCLDLASARDCINPRTRFLALTHVSNVFGTINPVAALVAMAHEVGAHALVDATQSIAHLPVDAHRLGCDFLVFSAHKMYGPTGIGVLWGRRDLIAEMHPTVLGGGMVVAVDEESAAWREAPERLEAGSPNLQGALGLEAAVKVLQSIRPVAPHRHSEELGEYMLERLLSTRGLRLHGPADPRRRLGIFAFELAGIHPHDVADACGELGVCVRAGNHCCQLLHERLGTVGSVRASLAIYNTRDDVDALVSALDYVRRQMR